MPNQVFEKILISSCFLGHKVRYDGQSKRLTHPLLEKWLRQDRLLGICPEILGGLPVPRPAAEIEIKTHKVLTKAGGNVTEQFESGAQQTLLLCKQHGIRFALLKESSPSCGSSLIYDGSFSNKKIDGQGICSQLLIKNGIKVFSENSIELLADLLK